MPCLQPSEEVLSVFPCRRTVAVAEAAALPINKGLRSGIPQIGQ